MPDTIVAIDTTNIKKYLNYLDIDMDTYDEIMGRPDQNIELSETFYVENNPKYIFIEGSILVPEELPFSLYFKSNLEPYGKVLNILNAHSDFKNVDSGVDLSFESTQFQYALNPFLNNLNIDNPLFYTGIDQYFPNDFFPKLGVEFPKYYYKNNPWYKLLNGDSYFTITKNSFL